MKLSLALTRTNRVSLRALDIPDYILTSSIVDSSSEVPTLQCKSGFSFGSSIFPSSRYTCLSVFLLTKTSAAVSFRLTAKTNGSSSPVTATLTMSTSSTARTAPGRIQLFRRCADNQRPKSWFTSPPARPWY